MYQADVEKALNEDFICDDLIDQLTFMDITNVIILSNCDVILIFHILHNASVLKDIVFEVAETNSCRKVKPLINHVD